MNNMNLWLLCDNEAVRTILLLKWKKFGSTNRVPGDMRLTDLTPMDACSRAIGGNS